MQLKVNSKDNTKKLNTYISCRSFIVDISINENIAHTTIESIHRNNNK